VVVISTISRELRSEKDH